MGKIIWEIYNHHGGMCNVFIDGKQVGIINMAAARAMTEAFHKAEIDIHNEAIQNVVDGYNAELNALERLDMYTPPVEEVWFEGRGRWLTIPAFIERFKR